MSTGHEHNVEHWGGCCCLCMLLVRVRDRCTHLGGQARCGSEPTGLACLALADLPHGEGYAQTGWTEHGFCEAFVRREPRVEGVTRLESTR